MSIFERSKSRVHYLEDFKYVSEHGEAFSGLSNVRKLALGIKFSPADSLKGKWSAKVGDERKWVGGNKPTQAVFNFLKVTNQLLCLEINSSNQFPTRNLNLNTACLSALENSFSSLTHLRTIDVVVKEEPKAASSTSLFLFQNLKMLSIDYLFLKTVWTLPRIEFSSSLEILLIPYYYSHDSREEDAILSNVLRLGSFPSLKLVKVPVRPIDRNGKSIVSRTFKKSWTYVREELKTSQFFESGKVELRLVEPGCFSEY